MDYGRCYCTGRQINSTMAMWPQSVHRIRQQNCEFTLNQSLISEWSQKHCWSLWATHLGLLTQLCQKHTHIHVSISTVKRKALAQAVATECAPTPHSAPVPANSRHSSGPTEHTDQHTWHAASRAVWLSPFAITPTLLPASVGLCDTVMAMWQQLLSPVLRGTLCHAWQHFDLFQTDWAGHKRRFKNLIHFHRINALCSFMEREEQKQSVQ